MPIEIWSQEWLNANSQRAYPLAEDADGADITDSFQLPQNFIVDLYLQVPMLSGLQPGRFFIRHIGAYSTGYSVVVGYDDGSDVFNVASALIARQTHTINRSYVLGGLEDFQDATGVVVIGRLDDIDLQPPGYFEFDLEGGRLEAEPIRPMLRGVDALVAVNGNDRSSRIQNVAAFIAGTNMRITAIPGNPPQIRFDAIEGEGLTEDCVCDDEGLGPPIRTIGGIGPDSSGNWQLQGGTCVEISATGGGVRLDDTCSEPCCGCPELTKMTEDLMEVERGLRTLENFAGGLNASVQQANQVFLGSRLGDRGCFSEEE